MKRPIISKFQGSIVVVTVLIAITLGMTTPSTVLGGKAQYVVKVELECITDWEASTTTAYAEIEFYSPKAMIIGTMRVECSANGRYQREPVIATSPPMTSKPAYFQGVIVQTPPPSDDLVGYCSSSFRIAFPALWAGQTNQYLNCVWPTEFVNYPQLHHVELSVFDPTPY